MTKIVIDKDINCTEIKSFEQKYLTPAAGWINGIYHERTCQINDLEYDDQKKVIFDSTSWWECGAVLSYDGNTSGKFFYNNANCLKFGIPNQNYQLTIELFNPGEQICYIDIIINGLNEQTLLINSKTSTSAVLDIALTRPNLTLEISGHHKDHDGTICTRVELRKLIINRRIRQNLRLKPKIFISSDSTVQTYETDRYPQAGWGECLYKYFKTTETPIISHVSGEYQQVVNYQLSDIEIENWSIGARSSKSFIEEKRFEQLLLNIQAGDYLFIQWAANDATSMRPNRYVAPDQFNDYLQRYVESVLARKATPVLITPPVTNHLTDTGQYQLSFKEYRPSYFKISKEYQCYLLDLGKESMELFNQMGPENARINYLQLDPLSNLNFPNGIQDQVHFQRVGANNLASLVAKQCQKSIPALEKLIDVSQINICQNINVTNLVAQVDQIHGCLRLTWDGETTAANYVVRNKKTHLVYGTTRKSTFNIDLSRFGSADNVMLEVQAFTNWKTSDWYDIRINLPVAAKQSARALTPLTITDYYIDAAKQQWCHICIDTKIHGQSFQMVGLDSKNQELIIDTFDEFHVLAEHYYCLPDFVIKIFYRVLDNAGDVLICSPVSSLLKEN